MASVSLGPTLRAEYETLFHRCIIRPARAAEVDALVASLIRHGAGYAKVQAATGVPWHVIAVIHNIESSQRFNGHLHNGDPLSARTRHTPRGRPRQGNPPFTWEESATDALALTKLNARTDWSLAGTLYQLERYNGFGYRLHHPHVLSPNLWSGSTHHSSGKYVADGTWSDTAVSRQCGAAVLLRRMAENGRVEFADQLAPEAAARPLVSRYASKAPADPAEIRAAMDLQNWLNTFPGLFVKHDGYPGKRTSEAYRGVTGAYLPGDHRHK